MRNSMADRCSGQMRPCLLTSDKFRTTASNALESTDVFYFGIKVMYFGITAIFYTF